MYNKYKKWYDQIISRAICENRVKLRKNKAEYVYYERHHILPKCAGGEDITENLVYLTAKEHYICHLLLPKFYEGKIKHKLINALIKMTYAKSIGQERYTARSYAIVRKLIAEKNREMFKGVPKSIETKSRMKGVCGKWERTSEYKESISGKNNHRFGKTGTFKGRKHSKESIDKRNITRRERGVKPPITHLGTKWYTNGVEELMCLPEYVPIGYYLGRSKVVKLKMKEGKGHACKKESS